MMRDPRVAQVVYFFVGLCASTLAVNLFLVYWLTVHMQAYRDGNRARLDQNQAMIRELIERVRAHDGVFPATRNTPPAPPSRAP